MRDIKAFIRGFNEFSELGEGELELLASSSKTEDVAKGNVVVPQGVKGEDLWLLIQGKVEISKKKGGAKDHLAYMSAPVMFGEISAFTGVNTTAEVMAEEDCKLLRIPGAVVSGVAKNNLTTRAKFAATIVKRLHDGSRRNPQG